MFRQIFTSKVCTFVTSWKHSWLPVFILIQMHKLAANSSFSGPLSHPVQGPMQIAVGGRCVADRVSSKQTKINFGSNQNKPKQDLFRVCFVKPKTKKFGSFRCFEPIWKQPKQPELFRNKPKQPQIFWKIPKYALYQTVLAGLLFFSVQSKHQNSLFRYRSETTETNVLFPIVPKLVSVPVSVFRIETSFEGHPSWRQQGQKHQGVKRTVLQDFRFSFRPGLWVSHVVIILQ